MIKFVNAKINIGLNIVRKRDDGYHDLETVFFPVGIESGMPQQPDAFDDILELNRTPSANSSFKFQFMGRRIDCDPERNLVVKAGRVFVQNYLEKAGFDTPVGMITLILDKHLPDGAGLGGGSADASFTLMALNELFDVPFSKRELLTMSRQLGADCPFFLFNRPCFAEGVGERLEPIDLNLHGNWLLIVKPEISISTKEAFAGIVPHEPVFNLRQLPLLPLSEWRGRVFNDFEATLFPLHPELAEIKESLYTHGALYASMTGSGSALYGIFDSRQEANHAADHFRSTYQGVWLFKL